MIKIIMAALVLWIVSGTKATAQDRSRSGEQHHEHATAERKHAEHQRWKLDESTRSNIATIRDILRGPAASRSLGQLGKELQRATNNMIRECRMQGADHEALHDWLGEYLKHLKQLQGPSGDRMKAYVELQGDLRKLDADFR